MDKSVYCKQFSKYSYIFIFCLGSQSSPTVMQTTLSNAKINNMFIVKILNIMNAGLLKMPFASSSHYAS